MSDIETLEHIAINYANLRRKVNEYLNWFEHEPPNMVYFIEKERQRCYLKAIEIFKKGETK